MTAPAAITLALALGVGLAALGRALRWTWAPEDAPGCLLDLGGRCDVGPPASRWREVTYATHDDSWTREGTTLVPAEHRHG